MLFDRGQVLLLGCGCGPAWAIGAPILAFARLTGAVVGMERKRGGKGERGRGGEMERESGGGLGGEEVVCVTCRFFCPVARVVATCGGGGGSGGRAGGVVYALGLV